MRQFGRAHDCSEIDFNRAQVWLWRRRYSLPHHFGLLGVEIVSLDHAGISKYKVKAIMSPESFLKRATEFSVLGHVGLVENRASQFLHCLLSCLADI